MQTGTVVNYDKGASLGASVVTYVASNAAAKGITSSTPGWSKVQIKASGVDLMSMDQDEVLYGFGGGFGRGLSAAATATTASSYESQTDGLNVICWGMDARSSGGNYGSGSQSLKELVNPALTVTIAPYRLATVAAKTFEVQVFHKVLTLNSISSSDGRISQSTSI